MVGLGVSRPDGGAPLPQASGLPAASLAQSRRARRAALHAMKASTFYSAKLWQLGLWSVRKLPPRLCEQMCRGLARGYCQLHRRRRETVIHNLLPGLNGDWAAASQAARELFENFALKLVDLWRFESGQSIDGWIREWTGWEFFEAARSRRQGILVLTPHLGNWELGGPVLTQRGLKLHVITQAEPETGLTQMRQAARARWGIETLVVGTNPFAYLEIIQRLKAGATVALLVDRPSPAGAVTVNLFGRPFPASLAAAELARASGAALIPVCLPRAEHGYGVFALPEIRYDPDQLEAREARIALTQEIIRAFEPVIRQYLNQWYHFVPIWPA